MILIITENLEMYKHYNKPDENRQLLKNWRPFTLISVIYKIASSCIAERLKTNLLTIINELLQ